MLACYKSIEFILSANKKKNKEEEEYKDLVSELSQNVITYRQLLSEYKFDKSSEKFYENFEKNSLRMS